MLKKSLVVVVALLVTASLANATLSLAVNSSTQAALVSDTDLGYNAYITVPTAIAHTFALTSKAGGSATIGASENYGDGLDWRFLTIAANPATSQFVSPGQQLLVDITAAGMTLSLTGNSNQLVQVWDSAGTTELARAYITAVPEPMTMALLGLGGLLLRKRK
jgi:hypothetical protein